MSTVETDRHLTTLDLDRFALGDLAALERQRVEAHADRCARCGGRRAQHETRVAQFRTVVLPRTLARLDRRRRPWHARLWAAAIALPALAVLALVIAHRFTGFVRGTGAPAEIGVKGDGQMQVFARRAGARGLGDAVIVRVGNGDRLAPGDALRFVLYPSGLPYALIASVDGAGQVSVYFPYHGDQSAAVDGALAVPVAGSIVLDGAPGPERLFAIFSERPIAARVVHDLLTPIAAGGAATIRAAGRMPLTGTQQATLLFEKELAR
jgi:predicted anti-sigma-YlaC factor YlaD